MGSLSQYNPASGAYFLNSSQDYAPGFQGPVKPGQTINGTNPLNQTTLSQYNPAQPTYWMNSLTGSGGSVLGAQDKNKPNPQGSGGGGNTNTNVTAPNSLDDQLRSLNSTYDYNAEQARNQLSALGDQYNQGVNESNTNFQDYVNQINKTKTNNLSEIDKQIQSAGSTAQQTQMKNRNIMRALGILNSSYAGEALQRPMEQFAMQRNDLMTAAQQRSQELDDMLTQRTSEHQNQLAALRTNYNNLVNQINTDLRFNDRQRADAVRAANSAMANNLYNLQSQQKDIVSQVQAQKQQLLQALQSMNSYAAPQANLSNINATQETPGVVKNQSQQAVIMTADELKKRQGLSSLY